MDEYPKVIIGCPVRNRGWILSSYLTSLYGLDYPKENIRLLFVLNDSTDNSEEILKEFKKDHESEYDHIDILTYNLRTPEDERTAKTRPKIYGNLAKVRNFMLSKIETPYFLSVDSDILIPPYTLKYLLADNKKIVAGVISNDYIENPKAVYPNVRTNLMIQREDGKIVHYKNYPLDSVFKVDVTGAFYLMTKEVCEKVRYDYDIQGEDIPFCLNAKAQGFEIWADSRVFGQHIMIVYQRECELCKRDCKAPLIKDNRKYPELVRCPKKIPK